MKVIEEMEQEPLCLLVNYLKHCTRLPCNAQFQRIRIFQSTLHNGLKRLNKSGEISVNKRHNHKTVMHVTQLVAATTIVNVVPY